MRTKILLLSLLMGASLSGRAQFELDIKKSTQAMNPAGIGVNFLVGPDAELFQPSVKVFGSGLLDFSASYTLLPFWKELTHNLNIGFPVGLRVAKYRFQDNLQFTGMPDGSVAITLDEDPTHAYNSSFFNYDGSKLVMGFLQVPLAFHSTNAFGIDFYGSMFYNRYLFAYHKLRYRVNDERVLDITRNSQMKDLPFTKDQFGMTAGIAFGNFGIGLTYLFTSLFESGQGPRVNEMRVGSTYNF